MFASIARDVRYAVTQLRRHPGVGAVVVLTLALGIGTTSVIFSAVNAVLVRPLPYQDPGRLVTVTSESGGSTLPRYVSGPDFAELERDVPVLAGLAGLLEPTVGPMTQVDRPEHVLNTRVTWNLFEVLGVEVALGRIFDADDAIPVPPDATEPPPDAAVISYDFWQRSFAGDPSVLGRVVHIWGGATEIVGVLPEGFRLALPPELNVPPDGDVWQAIRWDYREWSREMRVLRTVVRLAPGVTVRGAQESLDRAAASLRANYPHHAAERTELRARSLEAGVEAPMRGPLWVLMGAVSLVLLIACANVANLLLARGSARAAEMSVRASLGAGSGRLVRQLLTESAVLAALGAVAGIGLASVGVDLLHAIRPAELHRLEAVRLDLPVLGFAVLASIAATLLSGMVPAYHTARVAPGLRFESRGGIGSARRSRDMLVIGEVALSVVLLAGAGLLIRTFSELQRVPLGFDPDRLLTVTATQSGRPPEERRAYEAELLRAVREVPGVTASGIVFPLPMNGVYERSAQYAMDGRESDPSAWVTAYFRTVSPTYFDAMGLELRRGRGFRDSDENYAVPVVVLDERLAARAFPDVDPVGRSLWVRGMSGDTLRAEILGVVEYAPQWDQRDARPTMYFPREFYRSHEVSVVARVAGDPASVAPRLTAAIRGVDPTFPADLVPMADYVRERLARSRFLLILMQIFGVLALALSAVGQYGVLSYSVRQRRRELGLRLALGARGGELTRRVVARGIALAASGVGFGLLGALVVGRSIRSQLFGVGPWDPGTLAATAVLALSVAAGSSLVPALRAARVDPRVALTDE